MLTYDGKQVQGLHEIKKIKNEISGGYIYLLIIDGINAGSISDKNIEKYLKTGHALNDSDFIQQYARYNNL